MTGITDTQAPLGSADNPLSSDEQAELQKVGAAVDASFKKDPPKRPTRKASTRKPRTSTDKARAQRSDKVVKRGKAKAKATGRKASTGRKATNGGASSATRERKTQPLSNALISRVHKLSKSGKSLREIAEALNKSGETTQRGLEWTPQNVWGVVHRMKPAR